MRGFIESVCLDTSVPRPLDLKLGRIVRGLEDRGSAWIGAIERSRVLVGPGPNANLGFSSRTVQLAVGGPTDQKLNFFTTEYTEIELDGLVDLSSYKIKQ